MCYSMEIVCGQHSKHNLQHRIIYLLGLGYQISWTIYSTSPSPNQKKIKKIKTLNAILVWEV